MLAKELSSTENIKKIETSIKILKELSKTDSNEIVFIAIVSLEFFKNNLQEFINISKDANLHDELLGKINRIYREEFFKERPIDYTRKLLISLYKYFLYSKIFTEDFLHKTNSPVKDLLDFTRNNQDIFSINEKEEINNFNFETPVAVARELIHSPDAILMREFCRDYQDAKKYNDDWKAEFKKNKSEIELIKSEVENVKFEYNFVKIVEGFRKIRSQKKEESNSSYCGMVVSGSFMILTPIVFAYLASLGDKLNNNDYMHALAWLIPGLTIELLIVYFFRILLQQFKSIQAQLLQIDLRISLCQFIEQYILYKSTHVKTKDDALAKFETLIFSSIVADAGAIPSTFEGIEQVASIFKSVSSAKS